MRRREIDRDLDRFGHAQRVAADHAQHHAVDRDDLPGFLGQLDELDRRDDDAVAPPANERLDGDDRPGLQVDLGLIERLELVAFDRLGQIGFERAPTPGLLIEGVVEDVNRAASARLRAVEGDVAAAHDVRRRRAVARRDRQADAGVGGNRQKAELMRALQRAHRVLRDLGRASFRAFAFDENGEFVAAEPRRGDARLRRGDAPQAIGDRDEQLVARRVAQSVVDALEIVEIEGEKGDFAAVLVALGEGLRERLGERDAVGHACQRIVRGEEFELVRRGDLTTVQALDDAVLSPQQRDEAEGAEQQSAGQQEVLELPRAQLAHVVGRLVNAVGQGPRGEPRQGRIQGADDAFDLARGVGVVDRLHQRGERAGRALDRLGVGDAGGVGAHERADVAAMEVRGPPLHDGVGDRQSLPAGGARLVAIARRRRVEGGDDDLSLNGVERDLEARRARDRRVDAGVESGNRDAGRGESGADRQQRIGQPSPRTRRCGIFGVP